MAKNTIQKSQLTKALGVTGLSIWRGILAEEYLPALRGTRAYKVYQEMSDDTVIATLLDALKMPLLAAEFTVVPASKEQRDKYAADFIWECMNDMFRYTWRQHVLDCLSMLTYGWSVSEIVLKKRDDGQLEIDILDPRDQNTLQEWKVDDSGYVEAMKQRDPIKGAVYELPEWKLVHMTFRPSKRNPEGTSPMRSLYRSWYMRKNIEVLEGIGIERDAAGLPVLKLPYGAQKAESDSAETIIKNLRNDEEAGVVLPPPPSADPQAQKWELSLLGGASKAYNARETIRDYNKQILMRFFAQFLVLGMEQAGTQALVKGSHDFFSLALKSLQQEMLETWNNQLVPLLIEVNNLESPSGYPLIDWADPGKTDMVGLSTLLRDLTNVNIITPDDAIEDQVRALAGLPDREQEKEAHMKRKGRTKSYANIRGIDGRDQPEGGRDRAVALTNRYQKELLEAIDKFSADIEIAIKAIPEVTKPVLEQVVDGKLPQLLVKLEEISGTKIKEGWELGQRRGKRAPGLAAEQALRERLARNREFLSQSFIPDLRTKMITSIENMPPKVMKRKYQFDPFLLIGAIVSMRARLASYSGEVWEAIFSSAKISGQETDIERVGKGLKPRRVRWELDAGSQHCAEREGYYGCPDLAKEYDSWDAMPTVPGGKTACLTNCRCSISIQEDDGSWDMAI